MSLRGDTAYALVVFCNDTATTEIYTLALHDALPISQSEFDQAIPVEFWREVVDRVAREVPDTLLLRSEEHTSELQSHSALVCRLLLEQKTPRTSSARLLPTNVPPYHVIWRA